LHRDFDSSENDENDLQYEKHGDLRISTLWGISIDSSDEFENADRSIRFNREFDSKDRSSNALHPSKLFVENLVIESGIHCFLTSNVPTPAINNVAAESPFTIFRRTERSLI
jgi:hypothetical protein